MRQILRFALVGGLIVDVASCKSVKNSSHLREDDDAPTMASMNTSTCIDEISPDASACDVDVKLLDLALGESLDGPGVPSEPKDQDASLALSESPAKTFKAAVSISVALSLQSLIKRSQDARSVTLSDLRVLIGLCLILGDATASDAMKSALTVLRRANRLTLQAAALTHYKKLTQRLSFLASQPNLARSGLLPVILERARSDKNLKLLMTYCDWISISRDAAKSVGNWKLVDGNATISVAPVLPASLATSLPIQPNWHIDFLSAPFTSVPMADPNKYVNFSADDPKLVGIGDIDRGAVLNSLLQAQDAQSFARILWFVKEADKIRETPSFWKLIAMDQACTTTWTNVYGQDFETTPSNARPYDWGIQFPFLAVHAL